MRRLLLVTLAAVAACGHDHIVQVIQLSPDAGANVADLRGDSNRDGKVSLSDDTDANKLDWNGTTGAIFLANIDDDIQRCHADVNDTTIADCNDAADEVINGDDDALDLARLFTQPLPALVADATGTITIDSPSAVDKVRLFSRTGPNATDLTVIDPTTVFSAADLRAGIELAIEAKDIVRDTAVWDGYANVKLSIHASSGDSSDTVRMRVAPVLTFHHLEPEATVWSANTGRQGNIDMRTDLSKACTAAADSAPNLIETDDPWAQDYFEPAYMSMPGDGGAQHTIRVNYRSANVFEPTDPLNPLRPAGKFVFTARGKDVAGVQQFDVHHDQGMDSLNSFGNLETAPPHSANGVRYPFGRVVRGQITSFFPDPTFEKMIESQGQQPPIYIDTSWLLVGHVDETLSYVKANTPRGWKLLVNDARLAKQMLQDQVTAGNGAVTMFTGKNWVDETSGESTPAAISIANVLANTTVMQASAEAAADVDSQLAILKQELALTDDEIIKVPFLHTIIDGKSAAYQPGLVNGIYLSDTHFAAPNPHGPIINGKDIFEDAFTQALAPLGITVDYVEDWDEYHVGVGEVHCGTNSSRQIPDAKWWEAGR